MQSIPLKACTKCECEFPATPEYFYHDKRGSDGLSPRCKPCVNAYLRDWKTANAELDKDYKRRYVQQHPDRVTQSKRAWDQAHPEYKRQHYLNNPEYYREKSEDYYRANKEHVLAWRRTYIQENRELVRSWEKAARKKRLARERNLPAIFTGDNWRQALDYFDYKCAICGRSEGFWHKVAADHWIPLSDPRPDNPGTVPTNMIPMCHSIKDGENGCNNSKLNRDPELWLIEYFGKKRAAHILERVQTYFAWIRSKS